MALPEPEPGLVIRYDYLWSHEAKAGHDQGKDRPACLVVATDVELTPRFVVILPITRRKPSSGSIGVEIPPTVRAAIGLDEAPCWVIVSEHNVDEWPNPGLRPLPGRPRTFSYGFIPPRLFEQIRTAFLYLAKRGRSSEVRR